METEDGAKMMCLRQQLFVTTGEVMIGGLLTSGLVGGCVEENASGCTRTSVVTAVEGVVLTVELGGPRAMRAMRLVGGLVRECKSKRTRLALDAICGARGPPEVTRCGAVMVERRSVRLVRRYE